MTEDKTTITDNEVIGAFDGREDGYDEHGVWQKLKYNSDWRDLMPVWYKFKELKYPVRSSLASGQFYSLFLDYQRQIVKAITHSGPSPSEACKLLAEGIRWYNSTTQNKEQP